MYVLQCYYTSCSCHILWQLFRRCPEDLMKDVFIIFLPQKLIIVSDKPADSNSPLFVFLVFIYRIIFQKYIKKLIIVAPLGMSFLHLEVNLWLFTWQFQPSREICFAYDNLWMFLGCKCIVYESMQFAKI